ncbi:Phosphatidylinositol 4-kinase pik1alpha (PI4-kinase)(PtdIns-4-kinase) [Clydaea vesicula]|uniref:1-phosphatidylinositol 4-kinase n=1 Tax=Clydaea vesicula TaxID=447962 RepID=A0AAD5U6C5_9FUNG|nr:Phosphatidylinositol 4-kinase pik1alpha (PI4-kinase)(PtdIns-4-kinase) [Clydaea vesicula]
MSSNDLLLRLFQSDYFDARLAIQYLHRYNNNIGIQHYICNRLKNFPSKDVEFLLPQLCHLLLRQTSNSVALEEFILFKCESDIHIALLSLWYIQSYFHDLKSEPLHPSYNLCQRVYNRCQAVIFNESSKSNEEDNDVKNFISSVPIKENIPAAIIGIGSILGAAAFPFAPDVRQLVLSQGRKGRSYSFDQRSIERNTDNSYRRSTTSIPTSPTSSYPVLKSSMDSAQSDNSDMKKSSSLNNLKLLARISSNSPSLEDLRKGQAFSFGGYIDRTLNALSDDGANQISFKGTSPKHEGNILKNTHYVHSELQFILALVEIGRRLISVPREVRQTSLVAELTLLNHNLPADVCIPLWCESHDKNKHHRVMRISPDDCVVLNSADRAPYLMMVEVVDSCPIDTNYPENKFKADSHNAAHDSENKIIPGHNFKDHIELVTDLSGLLNTGDVNVKKNKNKEKCIVNEEEISNDFSEINLDEESKNENKNNYRFPNSYQSREEFIPVSLTSPEEYHQLVLNRRNSASNLSKINGSGVIDDFNEKLRTAAVMLAQLYQQQQKEIKFLKSLKKKKQTPLSKSTTNASTYTAVHALDGDYTLDDKLKYHKWDTEFELIRNRLEIQIANRKNGVSLGIEDLTDEILDEQQEQNYLEKAKRKEVNNDINHNGIMSATNEDPSARVFQESFKDKVERIKSNSPYGNLPNWSLISVIVKVGGDLRQEQFALQLINEIDRIWKESGVGTWVNCYRILVTSEDSGFIETIPDSISVHSVKKEGYAKELNQKGVAFTLYDYFVQQFGEPGSESFLVAQDNFMRSLAGYCIVCYILQVKDSPGSMGFELAPFKFPQEYIDILDGFDSPKFKEFRNLCKLSFLTLRKSNEKLISLVEIMEKGSYLACFTGVSSKPSQNFSDTIIPFRNSFSSDIIRANEVDSNFIQLDESEYPVSKALCDSGRSCRQFD